MSCSKCGGQKTKMTAGARGGWDITEAVLNYSERNVLRFFDDDEDPDPYVGPFSGSTVWVIGYNTEAERLFLRSKRSDALAWARQHKATLNQVHISQLSAKRAALIGL